MISWASRSRRRSHSKSVTLGKAPRSLIALQAILDSSVDCCVGDPFSVRGTSFRWKIVSFIVEWPATLLSRRGRKIHCLQFKPVLPLRHRRTLSGLLCIFSGGIELWCCGGSVGWGEIATFPMDVAHACIMMDIWWQWLMRRMRAYLTTLGAAVWTMPHPINSPSNGLREGRKSMKHGVLWVIRGWKP